MKTLIVEDDFTSRLLLQTFLSRYGECHIAVNGKEALELFQLAWSSASPYDLICMGIMMPEMDGREAVKRLRTLEADRSNISIQSTKIIMTTAVTNVKDAMGEFYDLCDIYLLKPIDLGELLEKMRDFSLVESDRSQ